MTHDAYIVEPGRYFVLDRIWHYRVGLEDQDWGAIHENWLGDPYHIAGSLSGATVLDIGGNIGTFALRALKEGAKVVYSFEPEPDNARMFELNCEAEMLDGRVTLLKAAVWPSGDLEMLSQHQGASAIEPAGTVAVPTISLPAVLKTAGPIDFMKMDIEGGEIENICTTDPQAFIHVKRFAMEYHGHTDRWGDMIRTLTAVFDLDISSDFDSYLNYGMLYGRNHSA